MRYFARLLLATGCALLLSSGARAEVVCNEDGDCWRVKEKYDYKPEFKLRVYGDDWKWADTDDKKYRWREGKGRGYWRDGAWIEF